MIHLFDSFYFSSYTLFKSTSYQTRKNAHFIIARTHHSNKQITIIFTPNQWIDRNQYSKFMYAIHVTSIYLNFAIIFTLALYYIQKIKEPRIRRLRPTATSSSLHEDSFVCNDID